MTLSTTAWQDGGKIPMKYTQPGHDTSPPLAWSGAPAGVESYVLLVHDIDAPTPTANDDALHWLVWDIPAAATSMSEGIPQGGERPDGSRQISMTGPYYRGPAAPSTGPIHHYVFEVFALDTTIAVPAVGASPAATRAAVMSAMAGHLRGHGSLIGVWRRDPLR